VVTGVTAGATGAIVGAVFVLARQSLVDATTALIAVGAFALTWLKWKIPDPIIVAAAAVIGLAVKS
jgi:chromate transporter